MTNNSHAHNLSPVDAAYIAGIIDGEGCIGARIRGKFVHPRLEVVNTNRELLLWMVKVTGVGKIYNGKKLPDRLAKYNWITSVQPAAEVLQQVMPYLKVKKLQAHLFCAIAHFRRIPKPDQKAIKNIVLGLAEMVTQAKRGGRKAKK